MYAAPWPTPWREAGEALKKRTVDRFRDRRSDPPVVLCIGGLDPGGGAGIVADVRTVAAQGGMPAAVATALTVQSGRGVVRSENVSPQLITEQLEEVLSRLPVAAVKIGQIPTAAAARAVAAALADRHLIVVLDPLRRAAAGGRLCTPAGAIAVERHLFPLADLLTVNLDEARVLTGRVVRDEEGMAEAARNLSDRGPTAVVVKGGHLPSAPVDVLYWPAGLRRYRGVRIGGRGPSMHGTGCAFASAAAVALADGAVPAQAVATARSHVRKLLRTAVRYGPTRLRRD